ITGVTATSLTVTSPAGTGTVDVTVTTPGGTSALNAPSDQFTYNAPALPTVSGTSLTVTVPAGTGTVSVTVTTTAGGSSTPLASAYTYNPPPTVTGVSPNN